MPNRIPLIYNSSAGQVQEISTSDSLDLSGLNVNAGIVSASIYSHPSIITNSILLDKPNHTYAHFGTVSIGSGVTVGISTNSAYIILSKQL